MSDLANCCSSAPECSDVPLVRDGAGEACVTYEPECVEGGTRTAGIPEYTLVVTNPVVGD